MSRFVLDMTMDEAKVVHAALLCERESLLESGKNGLADYHGNEYEYRDDLSSVNTIIKAMEVAFGIDVWRTTDNRDIHINTCGGVEYRCGGMRE